MPRRALLCLLPLVMFCLVGCIHRDAVAQFDITVTNDTMSTLSIGLIKNGPPLEEEWAAPHEIAIGAPHLAGRKWGTLLAPGKTTTLSQTGHFGEGVSAVLRAYVGDKTIDELIQVSRNAPDVVDVYLHPGHFHYVIGRDREGQLVATDAPGSRP